MRPEPVTHEIVLLGGGHAHVAVLKAFGMRPSPGVRLILVAKELAAPYSGMLPGLIAGHYSPEDSHIDLVRLARFANARLVHGSAIGVDRAARRVLIENRPPLAYDLLSIDVGITPDLDAIAGADRHAIAVKPISTFARKWRAIEAQALSPGGPRRIVVVGGGAGGFELMLAARQRLRQEAPTHGIDPDAFGFTLVAGADLLPSHGARARRLARQALKDASVALIENDFATEITPECVRLASGRTVEADATMVTTTAAAPAWFAATDLPRDSHGFLAIRPSLQLLDDDDVFAVGDCATVMAHPREKSGVFAVRQGPWVAENLRRRVEGRAARPFVPQKRFLSILSTGEKSAIAARGRFAASGRWAWIWKDWIDRRFVDGFNTLPIMTSAAEAENL